MADAKPFYADLLKGFPVVVVQQVVWGEMDSYQHVNNVVYFRYFENARLAYVEALRWPEFEEVTGIGPILAATQARFKRALTYPDTIAIGTRLHSLLEDRFLIEHLIISERQGAVVTEGQGTVVSYNYREGHKIPMPAELIERIRELEGRAV
jgi:acyl-CoA thioester hydrolase